MLGMLLSLASWGSAQPISENVTSNIQFKPGGLVINPEPDPGEVGFEAMEINFGERNVPIRAEVYYADGTSDSLEGIAQGGGKTTEPVIGILVNDSRPDTQSTGWNYSVRMSQYVPMDTARNSPFDATLYLTDGTAYSNSGGNGLSLQGNGEIVIETNNQTVSILTATQAAGKGSHGARWNREDIYLALGEGGTPTGFTVITDDIYIATLTWTLVEAN